MSLNIYWALYALSSQEDTTTRMHRKLSQLPAMHEGGLMCLSLAFWVVFKKSIEALLNL